jgi:hypothetical protein
MVVDHHQIKLRGLHVLVFPRPLSLLGVPLAIPTTFSMLGVPLLTSTSLSLLKKSIEALSTLFLLEVPWFTAWVALTKAPFFVVSVLFLFQV